MAARPGADVQCASFFGQVDVRVYQFREPLSPVRGHVEILKKGQFFFRFRRHKETNNGEHREEKHLKEEMRLQLVFQIFPVSSVVGSSSKYTFPFSFSGRQDISSFAP